MSFFQSLQQQFQETTAQLGSQINNISLQETAAQLQHNISQFGEDVKPLLQRTTRTIQERIGTIDDISELPKDYKDLEKQVDNLQLFYKRVLMITQQYELESYDYPPNLKESFTDVTSLLNEKIAGLSHATTTQEAEKILLAGRKDQTPKTFAHQFGRALKLSRESILDNKPVSTLPKLGSTSIDIDAEEPLKDNALTIALQKIADIQIKVGNERLEQDKLVIAEFNNKVKTLLKNDFSKTATLRKQVENARLNFDTVRAEIKSLQKGDADAAVPPQLTQKLENNEDELVSATEVAVESMKSLIKPYESVNLLKVLVKIQLNYHKNVVSDLSLLVDDLDAIQFDNEDD